MVHAKCAVLPSVPDCFFSFFSMFFLFPANAKNKFSWIHNKAAKPVSCAVRVLIVTCPCVGLHRRGDVGACCFCVIANVSHARASVCWSYSTILEEFFGVPDGMGDTWKLPRAGVDWPDMTQLSSRAADDI